MCRSIKTLRGADPTPEEVRAAALQFVRKVSGYRAPSRANEAVFTTAVDEIEAAAERLLAGVVPPPGPPGAGCAGQGSFRTFPALFRRSPPRPRQIKESRGSADIRSNSGGRVSGDTPYPGSR